MKKLGKVFIVLLTGLAVLDAINGDIGGVLLNGGLGMAWVCLIGIRKGEWDV